MAVRGVYTAEEEKIIADFKKTSSEQVGWVGKDGEPEQHTATLEAIEKWGRAADYWNPLWWDENYAKNTGWGGIIAFPFFEYCLNARPSRAFLNVPPEVGNVRISAHGDLWDFHTPVRPGDTIKFWNGNEELEDVTALDGKSPRQFKILTALKFINQHDQVTSVYHRYNSYMIVPPGAVSEEFLFPAENSMDLDDFTDTKDSKYTKEEIEAIDRIANAEEIRGSEPRYWEDVNVGDKLTPIVQGPITLWDGIVNIQSFGFINAPMREVLRGPQKSMMVDPDTNIRLHPSIWRLEPRVAKAMGHYSTTLFEPFINQFLGRLITNWMGDDGFILRSYHRKASNTPMGDTIVGTGKVIRKYRGEKGTYLVDLAVEMETNRGNITNTALTTVSLPPKE